MTSRSFVRYIPQIRCVQHLALAVLAMTLAPGESASAQPRRSAPAAIFVTWNGDPTTTVSVDWHLAAGTDIRTLEVRGPGLAGWRRYTGDSIAFPFSSRTVRRAQIEGLRPQTSYELRVGGSRVYRYRTMPARLTRPIKFATGGDTQADMARFGPMNRMAAARDVDFVLFGGDLAYSNGDPRLVSREEAWYETITRTLVTRDGRLIPVIAAIGNHEVFSNRDTSAATVRMVRETGVKLGDSPYYSALHAHARGRQYHVVDVGDYLSLVLLNSAHTAPVGGAQAEWLEGVLAKRAAVPHLFPVYHVPGYPSVRAFEGSTSAQVREHWAPLFERFGVRVAFENHDHAYKRTFPMRGGQRDSTGVVYVGDGAWGAGPRPIGRDHKVPVSYLAQTKSANHGVFVTLEGAAARLDAVDTAGSTFDTYSAPKRATTTASVRVEPDYFTRRDTTLNLDSPAIWHGPGGQAWLLTSAKTGDRIRIDDATSGRFIADLGSSGTGLGQLRRPNGVAVLDSLLFVVERDNARVQVFTLPTRRPVGVFGVGELTRPYGITVERRAPGQYVAFVTDNFETKEGSIPADSLLAPRLRSYQIDVSADSLRATPGATLGGTSGEAVAHVVESVAVDTEHDRLFLAEEQEGRSHVKLLTRDGRHTGVVPSALFPSQAEGIALYRCGRDGYVVMTDQSRTANAFHVFDRASMRHVGSFGLTGVTNTDGIAVTSTPVGKFRSGALFAVDDDGRVAAVSWTKIAARLGLKSSCATGQVTGS